MILLMVLPGLMACHQTPKEYYEIEGRVRGVDDGVVFSLFRINGRAGMAIDHDTLRDGRFFFRVKPEAAEREQMTILCWHNDFPSMALHLWAEAGDRVRVEGNDPLIFTWEVKGPAPENRSWQGYNNCARDLYDELQRLTIEENKLRFKVQNEGLDQATAQSLYDSLGRLQQEVVVPKIHGRLIERMQRVQMDEVGLIRLEEMASMCRYYKDYPHRKAVEGLYNSLDAKWLEHPAAQRIHDLLYPVKEVTKGEPMVDGELFDLAGNRHTLGELGGEYILLDFWSAGCGPCMMALPEMAELAEKYRGRLQVVSVTTDTEDLWRKTSAEHPISWHNWSDGKERGGLYAHYDQPGIPNYTLISPDGIILDRWVGYGLGSLKMKLGQYLE